MKRILCITILAAMGLSAQTARQITSPKAQFGFDVGADYRLVNYSQLEAYWKKLASESDRIKLTDIGTTAEGRHQWMAIITSPENLKHLARYKEISRKLAAAEGLSSDQAHALAREGKAVVWIDGGLARNRDRRIAAATGDGVSNVDPQRCGDHAPAERRHSPLRARESRRTGIGGQLVHARKGRKPAHDERPAPPVQQICRP